jgi:hypothetical protein
MLLGFKIDGPEDLNELRHFAECDYHFGEAVRALRNSVQRYLEMVDAGGDGKNFIGIQITGDDSPDGPPDDGRGDWIPMDGPPQDGRDPVAELLGAIFGPHMPKTDPRMN